MFCEDVNICKTDSNYISYICLFCQYFKQSIIRVTVFDYKYVIMHNGVSFLQ